MIYEYCTGLHTYCTSTGKLQ